MAVLMYILKRYLLHSVWMPMPVMIRLFNMEQILLWKDLFRVAVEIIPASGLPLIWS